MTGVKVNKWDVIWSYLATFLSIASGLIVLPVILHMLSADEVGYNYLLITIGQLVALFDFGFAPQFGRNISYIFGGAQKLEKTGFSEEQGDVNYHLLKCMIDVAKMVYRRLSIFVLVVMLLGGSIYIYKATEGFTLVKYSLIIWLVYCLSVYFNLYYTYYTSLLTGRGLIREAKKAMIVSKLSNILLTIGLLYTGLGLLSISIANLVTPFLYRFLSYKSFYTNDIKEKLRSENSTGEERKELFLTIWYNAKKIGVVFVATYATTKAGLFLAGLFLTLKEVGSYGLLMQLVTFMSSLSLIYFNTAQPEISSLRASSNCIAAFNKFKETQGVFYVLYILGSLGIALFCPWFFTIIGSNTVLPSLMISLLYCLVNGLEQHHSSFATYIVTGNSVPFVKPSIYSGLAILLTSYLSLQFTNLGILGLVLAQGCCQLVYNNWKWPYVVLKQNETGIITFMKDSVVELYKKLKLAVR